MNTLPLIVGEAEEMLSPTVYWFSMVKPLRNRVLGFTRCKSDGGSGTGVRSVDHSCDGAADGGHGDRLPVEINILEVGPGGDQYSVAVRRGIDACLDGWLVGRNVNGASRRSGHRKHQESRTQNCGESSTNRHSETSL